MGSQNTQKKVKISITCGGNLSYIEKCPWECVTTCQVRDHAPHARDHVPHARDHVHFRSSRAPEHTHTHFECPAHALLGSQTCISLKKCTRNTHKSHKYEHFTSQDTALDIAVSKTASLNAKITKIAQSCHTHDQCILTSLISHPEHSNWWHHHCIIFASSLLNNIFSFA